jgi:hypothetical protein
VPKLAPLDPGREPTAQEWFERRMYLLGITEREVIERLWRERLERERQARNVKPRR